MKSIFIILFCAISSFANNCRTLKTTPQLLLQKCDNLNILWLHGTPIERARAHGELLGHEFTLENLELFVNLSMRGIEKGTFKYKLIDSALNLLVRWSATAAPESYHEEIKAMADAAHVDEVKLKRAILLPDISAFSWAVLSKQGKNLPNQGCTSAVYAKNGQYIQGRNLDFPGSPSYDHNPLLVVHKPAPGSQELQHVSIGTHGLQFSGITGFNEAGITFAVHQNYTRLKSIKGVPMPYVGELVLRKAKSLDEAVEIIKSNRPGPLWTFVLSNLNTQEALTAEVSNSHFAIRRMESEYFAQTNHLIASPKSEFALMDAGTNRNSQFRFQKALDVMREWKNPTAQNMAQLLGYQLNPQSFSPVSDVLKSLTIQSVVYEKENLKNATKFYVTIDASPAPTGRWMEIDLNRFWSQSSFVNADYLIHDFMRLPAAQREKQIKWTEIYAYDIMRHYPQVIERLAPIAENPDSLLALGAIQLKVNNPKEALVAAQKGLKLANQDPSTTKLIRQGLKWVEIASLWHLNKKDMVLSHALSLKNEGIDDPGMSNEIEKLLKKEDPSDSSLRPGFDFFGGYLQGMPTRPND